MSTSLSTFCCSVTPFDKEGRIDEDTALAHFSRVADAGVNLYVGGSSPGEGYSFTDDEMSRILKIAVQAGGGRVAVRAMGVEPRDARTMRSFLKLAADSGVDACQIYSLDVGHGWKPGAGELEAYFRASLDACPLPAVLSSHAYMGYNIPIDMLERLANDYDKLIGINLTTPDMMHLSEAMARLRPRLEIHVGGVMNMVTALALGGNGYLSSEANLAPHLCAKAITDWSSGQLSASFKTYEAIMALMVALYSVPDVGASVRRLKAAMRYLGHRGTYVREPFAPLRDEDFEKIGSSLEQVSRLPGAEELVLP